MATLRRKRKGTISLESIGIYFSDDTDVVRQFKKKCRGLARVFRAKKVGSWGRSGEGKVQFCACEANMTAPPSYGLPAAGSAARGLKRKIGCVESATNLGSEKLEKEYLLGHEIGKGKFGSVRLCQSRESGEEFACKTLKNGKETVEREVEIMQHLSGHPGIVTIKEVFQDQNSFHIVMELCSGGRLSDQMKNKGRYPEQEAALLMKELISIIKYCHEMGVVHRDIKPENILLSSSGKMKLADFGLAVRITPGQKLSGHAGTPQYIAPEVLKEDYSEKVDVWSAGIVLHRLLVGVYAFPLGPRQAVFEAVKNFKLDFDCELWESTSALGRDLLGKMLVRDVSERLGAEDVLSHPWILFHTGSQFKLMPGELLAGNNLKSRNGVVIIATMTSQSTTSLETSNSAITEQGGCAFIDSLVSAISRMTINDSKHSKLCSSVSPIKEESSPNLKSNLCPAF